MPPKSNRTDRYALVGHPVSHSRSPFIHQLFARQTGEDLSYELIDATPDQFETAALGFAAAGGLGMNVTVPHKEAAFDLCQTHGKEAKAARPRVEKVRQGLSLLAEGAVGASLFDQFRRLAKSVR